MINPTMKIWTDTWHEANQESFKNLYSDNAVIFPPNKACVKGREEILQLMKGGLGKVDVIFEPENFFIENPLAFEYGIFKDIALESEKILGTGQYSVTWIVENSSWKILCHTWTIPEK